MARRFKRGTYKVRCDLSGTLVNSDQVRKMWNGLIVRKELWTPRHPQDKMAKPTPERKPAHPRPEGEPEFIEATDITAEDL